MKQYESIATKLQAVRAVAASDESSMTELVEAAEEKITGLEEVKREAEDLAQQLEEYVSNLDGLSESFEEADRIRSDAENLGIDL